MKIICVSGKIGTGKTTFCKKLIHTLHTTKFHKHYIEYINIDSFVKNVHKHMHTNTKILQKILFYSGNHTNFTTKKTWFFLNKKFKGLIISHIYAILYQFFIQKNNKISKNKKILLFDIALQNYFLTALQNFQTHSTLSLETHTQYIHLEKTNLYTQLFLLKKYRNISFHKSLKILQQQI